MNKKIIFTEDKIEEIIKYYLYPHSLKDTAKFAGITKTKIIHDLLIEHNIKLRSKQESIELQTTAQQKYFTANNTKTFKTLVEDEVLKNSIVADYIVNNMQYKYLLQKYELSWAMLGRLLKAWNIKKDKSQQTDNITKNKFEKYNVSKEELQEFFNNNTVEDTSEHFGIPGHFLYKMLNTLEIDWTLHNKNIPNGSKPEEKYYEYLANIYGEENVKRQYNEDPRYPFHCDFYIVPEDKFIELNYHWTHGDHPFDKTNNADIQKLANWQQKAKKSGFYKVAIQVWTVSDPLKLEYMIKNNLNYEILYSC